MRMGFVAGAWMIGCTVGFAAMDAPRQQVDWKSMLPMVRLAVRHEFPKVVAQAHYPPSILRTADLDDGVSVAVVDLGTGGFIEEMTVMRLEGATPVAARFRQRDDKIGPLVFSSGVSEGEGEVVELVPNDHAVFAAHWKRDGTKLKKCGGEAYQWDSSAKNFGFEKKLSKTMTREFCQKVEAQMVNAPAGLAPLAPVATGDSAPVPR